jgi:hypothetical protein
MFKAMTLEKDVWTRTASIGYLVGGSGGFDT